MSKKFAMNTTAFLILWKSMLGKKNQWENFVVSCFDTFAKDNNDYTGTYTGYKSFNPEQTEHLMYFGSLSGHDEPVEHTDEHKYQRWLIPNTPKTTLTKRRHYERLCEKRLPYPMVTFVVWALPAAVRLE